MQDILTRVSRASGIHLNTVSANQTAPWTFRVAPDVDALARDALERLRWSKTTLVNEALRRGIPVILAEQARLLAGISEVSVAVQASTAVETRATRRRALEGE